MLSWMQPMTVTLPLAGIAPVTGYCGPGPERTLSGITADATIAAEAAEVTATAAAAKSVVLIRIADLLMTWEYLRNVSAVHEVPRELRSQPQSRADRIRRRAQS